MNRLKIMMCDDCKVPLVTGILNSKMFASYCLTCKHFYAQVPAEDYVRLAEKNIPEDSSLVVEVIL